MPPPGTQLFRWKSVSRTVGLSVKRFLALQLMGVGRDGEQPPEDEGPGQELGQNGQRRKPRRADPLKMDRDRFCALDDYTHSFSDAVRGPRPSRLGWGMAGPMPKESRRGFFLF